MCAGGVTRHRHSVRPPRGIKLFSFWGFRSSENVGSRFRLPGAENRTAGVVEHAVADRVKVRLQVFTVDLRFLLIPLAFGAVWTGGGGVPGILDLIQLRIRKR